MTHNLKQTIILPQNLITLAQLVKKLLSPIKNTQRPDPSTDLKSASLCMTVQDDQATFKLPFSHPFLTGIPGFPILYPAGTALRHRRECSCSCRAATCNSWCKSLLASEKLDASFETVGTKKAPSGFHSLNTGIKTYVKMERNRVCWLHWLKKWSRTN